jgi:hypothetical protein
MAPSWCDGVLEAKGRQFASQPREWSGDITRAILFSCKDPGWHARQQVVAAYRQQMSNEFGLSNAANERLMKLGAKILLNDALEREHETNACRSRLAPIKSDTAFARGMRALQRVAVDCGTRVSSENALSIRDIDVPALRQSQLAQAAVVLRILEQDPDGGDDGWRLGQTSNVATLHAVISFDPAAFERELETLNLNAWGQSRALITYARARSRLERLFTQLTELSPRVTGLSKMLVDGPRSALRDYEAKIQGRAELTQVVAAIDAQRDEAENGCAQKLWPHLRKNVAREGSRPLAELNIDGPLAYALGVCARRDIEVPALEPIFSYYTYRANGWHGPLSAAYHGVLKAYNDAVTESESRGIDLGQTRSTSLRLPKPTANPSSDGADWPSSLFGQANTMDPNDLDGGIVEHIERLGATSKIVFKVEIERVPILNCTKSNRIRRIERNGDVTYEEHCVIQGWREQRSTPSPIEVPTWAAEGVAKGRYVVTLRMSMTSKASGRAWVVEVYESKEKKRRLSLFGIAL